MIRRRELAWIASGAGMGLVVAFATRWYWGFIAFAIVVMLMSAASLRGDGGTRAVRARLRHRA